MNNIIFYNKLCIIINNQEVIINKLDTISNQLRYSKNYTFSCFRSNNELNPPINGFIEIVNDTITNNLTVNYIDINGNIMNKNDYFPSPCCN